VVFVHSLWLLASSSRVIGSLRVRPTRVIQASGLGNVLQDKALLGLRPPYIPPLGGDKTELGAQSVSPSRVPVWLPSSLGSRRLARTSPST
jgi:hypothetical protein